MHEWALAESVIKTVLKVAEENNIDRIIEVKIKIGEMQQLEHDVFKSALLNLKPDELKDAEFIVEIAETRLRCRVCSNEWYFQKEGFEEDVLESIHFLPEVSHAYVKCPVCGSPDFEIVEGRGIWVESVKGVRSND
ncbi:MAG: hydrogenase nickel incorporation protein HypA [Thermoproteota archaeon]